MRLKEAFNLQNTISRVYGEANQLLSNPDVFANKQIKHIYSKANIGNDVIEDVPLSTKYAAGDQRYSFDKLVNLAQAILEDKQKLIIAIDRAKSNNSINYDALKQTNVIKYQLFNSLSNLQSVKDHETDGYNDTYGKDNDGKPATFRYPIKNITSYDIDKNHLRAILKRLKNELDETSMTIDELSLSINVDFSPKFDYNSRLEDIYLEFSNN